MKLILTKYCRWRAFYRKAGWKWHKEESQCWFHTGDCGTFFIFWDVCVYLD